MKGRKEEGIKSRLGRQILWEREGDMGKSMYSSPHNRTHLPKTPGCKEQMCVLRRARARRAYLAGLFGLWFDADEDVQLLHECCDALRLHFDVLFNVEHQHQRQAALRVTELAVSSRKKPVGFFMLSANVRLLAHPDLVSQRRLGSLCSTSAATEAPDAYILG